MSTLRLRQLAKAHLAIACQDSLVPQARMSAQRLKLQTQSAAGPRPGDAPCAKSRFCLPKPKGMAPSRAATWTEEDSQYLRRAKAEKGRNETDGFVPRLVNGGVSHEPDVNFGGDRRGRILHDSSVFSFLQICRKGSRQGQNRIATPG